MRYPKSTKRMRLRGQDKLIREAHLALRLLHRTQASFDTGTNLERAITKVQRIEYSLVAGKYIAGAIEKEDTK